MRGSRREVRPLRGAGGAPGRAAASLLGAPGSRQSGDGPPKGRRDGLGRVGVARAARNMRGAGTKFIALCYGICMVWIGHYL